MITLSLITLSVASIVGYQLVGFNVVKQAKVFRIFKTKSSKTDSWSQNTGGKNLNICSLSPIPEQGVYKDENHGSNNCLQIP
jgi:hypothetical protein